MLMKLRTHALLGAAPLARFERALAYDVSAPAPRYDGLSAFTPMWAIATLFSLAGDPYALGGERNWHMLLLAWTAVAGSVFLLVHPRATWLLAAVAAVCVALYVYRLPVASNNKTITAFMNGGVLLVMGVLTAQGLRGETLRETIYERLRMIARGLLLTMYFYGIFHKINTDFLDPRVSCAVGLYEPLARPFGLADNLWGKYLAIYATFVVEAIAMVGLVWRRYFAIGLITALVFHYVIPISAFSWYMDFSSLVFALYMLSMPKAASEEVYRQAIEVLRPVRRQFGRLGVILPGALLLLIGAGVVAIFALNHPISQPMLLHHSVWIIVWAVAGGVGMTAMTAAALNHLPYTGPGAPPQPRWVWAVPAALFVMCLSPYVGLKTESSINMFSNLHTEAGISNHLMLPKPPYLFDYQRQVVMVRDSSDPKIRELATKGEGMVLFSLKEYLRKHPQAWISFEQDGRLVERATANTFAGQHANLIERNILLFKPVDFERPKACTH